MEDGKKSVCYDSGSVKREHLLFGSTVPKESNAQCDLWAVSSLPWVEGSIRVQISTKYRFAFLRYSGCSSVWHGLNKVSSATLLKW